MSIHDFCALKRILAGDDLPGLLARLDFGDYRSGYKLGLYYLDASHRDIVAAINYLTDATTHGIAEAMTVLGDIYYNGDFCVQTDFDIAVSYYRMAADLDDFSAIRELALLYAARYAVVKNPLDQRISSRYATKLLNMGYDDIFNMIEAITHVRLDMEPSHNPAIIVDDEKIF